MDDRKFLTLAITRPVLLILGLLLLLFMFGCATTEYHRETQLEKENYDRIVEDLYNAIKRELNHLKEGQKLALTRTDLENSFACLKYYPSKIYENNSEPLESDPPPGKEFDGRVAALIFSGQNDLWHMVDYCVNIECFSQKDSRFLITVRCPYRLISHYSRGPLQNLWQGPQETVRGKDSILFFLFKQEGPDPKNHTTQRLVAIRKEEKTEGTKAKQINTIGTRFFDLAKDLLGIGEKMIPFKP